MDRTEDRADRAERLHSNVRGPSLHYIHLNIVCEMSM